MIEPIDVLVSLLMIAGQWNIAQRRAAGWWLFLATNVILIGIAWQTARWGLIPGYLILSGINLYGLAKWHRPIHSSPRIALATRGLKETL